MVETIGLSGDVPGEARPARMGLSAGSGAGAGANRLGIFPFGTECRTGPVRGGFFGILISKGLKVSRIGNGVGNSAVAARCNEKQASKRVGAPTLGTEFRGLPVSDGFFGILFSKALKQSRIGNGVRNSAMTAQWTAIQGSNKVGVLTFRTEFGRLPAGGGFLCGLVCKDFEERKFEIESTIKLENRVTAPFRPWLESEKGPGERPCELSSQG